LDRRGAQDDIALDRQSACRCLGSPDWHGLRHRLAAMDSPSRCVRALYGFPHILRARRTCLGGHCL